MPGKKTQRPLPGQDRASRIVDLTAPFVEESMIGIVAIQFRRRAFRAHGCLQRVNGSRRAPVVLARKVPLKRDADIRGIGKLPRRNAIEAHACGKLRHMHGGGDGQRAAHAETHGGHLAATRQIAQVIDRAANVLVRGAGKIQAVHQVVGLVGLLRHAALEQIGRQGVVPGSGQAIGDAANLIVEPPPLLNYDHARTILRGVGKVTAARAAVRPVEFDHLSHACLLGANKSGNVPEFQGDRRAGALPYNAFFPLVEPHAVNPDLSRLQPYPFEKLRHLFAGVSPAPTLGEIKLSIGEPQHATPPFIQRALADNLAGLANYPTTQGSDALRQAIADWIGRRYGVPAPDAATQVIPVNGSREALFAFAQTVIDRSSGRAKVVCPNPFYQIYEGAAILAGAEPVYLNTLPDHGFEMDWAALPESTWRDVQLVYVCSPANPTGKVMGLDSWKTLFELSDRYNFVIASDECYSEIYFDEAKPPLCGLTAAAQLGRHDYPNLVSFSSLSKRSNVPGLRSGFVAGNAAILKKFLLYRTYHGSAMNPAVQAASIAAWNDEAHVRDNRRMYAEKFHEVTPLVAHHLDCRIPDAGFYLWARTPVPDTEFARELLRQKNVVVLPGSYLARESGGVNPGANFIRIALVAPHEKCLEAARRINDFCLSL